MDKYIYVYIHKYMTDIQNGSQILIPKENLTQKIFNMTQDHFLMVRGNTTIIKLYTVMNLFCVKQPRDLKNKLTYCKEL